MMQIYDDRKNRIGTLQGFRNRVIETTLGSDDKELSFEYPANGKLTELLKEEYYIRTLTDEFVIKAVEKSGDYNKYTAIMNVEELEGQQFPYGFASVEQTIKACLEFAFEGTGWRIGTCTVTKKRTIDSDESVTAWGILLDCIKTYRCECKIDSINKTINIYEQVGQDRGCYFIEGLNLRKLTAKSDTYDFYTRIIPLGKDGITIEWLHGKEYLENYQYSNKAKTYTWKDERYTNTTSLIEDAEAKLEEMSKPYKAYVADIIDLARSNPVYANVLDYGIGDTVHLVSQKSKVKEKQRIVKIKEYPESPEKNTAELSNATKTFAELQRTETELAKSEAISISHKSTKKILEDYSTTEEIETKITASKEAVELGVLHTLESYYDKTETDAIVKLTKGEIELAVSQIYQTKEAMEDYSTTSEIRSAIDIAIDNISLEISKTYAKTGDVEDAVKDAEYNAVKKAVSEAGGAVDEKLTSYSTTEEIQSAINIAMDEIRLGISQNYATTIYAKDLANKAEEAAEQSTDEKLKLYSNTEEMKSAIDIAIDGIALEVSKIYVTEGVLKTAVEDATSDAVTDAVKQAEESVNKKLYSYSTKEEMQAAINIALNEISLNISQNYATTTYVNNAANNAVTTAGKNTDNKLVSYSTTTEMNAAIKAKADSISLEVSKKVNGNEIISTINQTSEKVSIDASKIDFNGIVTANQRFKILTDGSFEAVYGKIGGWTVRSTYLESTNGRVKLYSSGKITVSSSDGRTLTLEDATVTGNGNFSSIQAGSDVVLTPSGSNSYLKMYDAFGSGGTDAFKLNGVAQFMKPCKIFNLSHVSSGGHLVFASDGATLAYLGSSSKRYKDGIGNVSIEEAKEMLRVPTVWYMYKDGYLDNSDRMCRQPIPGFYAEDMEKYFPEAVQYNDKGEAEDWNFRIVIPIMFRLIQGLYEEKNHG